jgi:hypothetical protein
MLQQLLGVGSFSCCCCHAAAATWMGRSLLCVLLVLLPANLDHGLAGSVSCLVFPIRLMAALAAQAELQLDRW